jgi:signal transduction histidine kinase
MKSTGILSPSACSDLALRDVTTEPGVGATERGERFLGQASWAFAESLDYERTLNTVVCLAVPEIADWCSVDILADDGRLVRASSAPRDGKRDLDLNATFCAPLIARGRVLGAITVCTALGRDSSANDVGLTQEFARRAAVAIDNAQRYRDAQRAVRARDEILAVVTHDLRTPLSSIVAAASLLSGVDAVDLDGHRIRERGETIQRAARHMSRLLQDLTDAEHIDSGRLAIARTLESPVDVLREAVEALEPTVRRAGGTLNLQMPSVLPRLSLDANRIRQVLANLVGNASKVGASAIVVGAELLDAELVCWVADNGPGIPPADQPRIFDRYWRGAETHYAGSGLGLSIAAGIVAAHGGRIWLDSTVDVGSTFSFSLPRKLAEGRAEGGAQVTAIQRLECR